MFVILAGSRKGLKARDKFKAAVAAGHEREVALYTMLAKYGLHIGDGENWPTIKSVQCLLRNSLQYVEFAVSVV